MEKLQGYVKCEGRRWYLWDEQAWKWERATVDWAVSRHIVREVRELIVQAVMEDRYKDAHDWCQHLDPTDIDIRLTPHMSRIYRENQALPRGRG
jgi:hypothetical protein